MATVVDLDCPIFQNIGTGEQPIGVFDRSLQFADNRELNFGDAQDIQMGWDGTDFDILPVANNSVVKLGNGTLSVDLWVYGSAAANYIEWDASANTLYLRGVNCVYQQAALASVTGSGVALSASKTSAFRVYVDDGNAAIASSVFARAGVFRHLQTYTAGNREQEAAGVVGQVVSVAGTNRHNMCGVMGSYEASTSLTVDGQAPATDPWIQAAVIGRVGVGTAITTINANGILAGVAAMSNTVSFSANNGSFSAFYAGKWSGTTNWSKVLHAEATDTTQFLFLNGGIMAGSVTTGSILQFGTLAAPVDLNTAGAFGIRGYVSSTSTSGGITGMHVRAMANAASAGPSTIGIQAYAQVTASKYAQDVVALDAAAIAKSAGTMASGGWFDAGQFKVEDARGTDGTSTAPTYGGYVAILRLMGQISADPTNGYYGIFFDFQTAAASTAQNPDGVLAFQSGGQNGTIAALIYHTSTLATLGSTSTNMVSSGTLTNSSAGDVLCDGRIRVNIGGTSYWIPLFDTAA